MRTMERAFTLVELLTVIAIISILAAMLLPSMENALRSARRTACADILRQWAVCIHLYANDRAERLPSFRKPTTVPTIALQPFSYPEQLADGSSLFSRNLAPYGGERNHRVKGGLWECPDSPSQPFNYFSNGTSRVAYGYMGYRGTDTYRTWWAARITDVVTNKRKTILMADSMYVGSDTNWALMYNHGNPNDAAPTVALSWWAPLNGIAFRPFGVNVTYIDTAVRWIEWRDLDKSVYCPLSDSRNYYWTE